LWNNGDSQGPCPNGWQVPTSGELSGLGSSGTFSSGNKRLEIPGDNSIETLYLPVAGGRNPDGTWTNQGGRGNYWSSTVSGTDAIRLTFTGYPPGTAGGNRASGYTVRCIQK
jgi:hypothetical protein